MRKIMVMDIRFYSRKLELLSSGVLTPTDIPKSENTTKLRISQLTSDLEAN